MNVLQKAVKEKEFKPKHIDEVRYLFFSNGFTPRQLEEEFTVPEIISIILTHAKANKIKKKK